MKMVSCNLAQNKINLTFQNYFKRYIFELSERILSNIITLFNLAFKYNMFPSNNRLRKRPAWLLQVSYLQDNMSQDYFFLSRILSLDA